MFARFKGFRARIKKQAQQHEEEMTLENSNLTKEQKGMRGRSIIACGNNRAKHVGAACMLLLLAPR